MVRGLEELKRSLGADVRHNRQERRMGQKSKRELEGHFWSMFYLVNSLPNARFFVFLRNVKPSECLFDVYKKNLRR